MAKLKLSCWNVNGIRAVAKKGFFEWMEKDKADIVCLQENKISEDQLTPELLKPKGYASYWNHASKRGYSGTTIYTKEEPLSIAYGMGKPRFDSEGRMLVAEYADFYLLNVYFPNGKKNEERLQFKLDFYDEFLKFCGKLKKKGKGIIVCGDFNTAHKEIDLARPKDNVDVSGFLPSERAWMDEFVEAGFIDTFRAYDKEPHKYSWWHMRTAARERNVGWRIDYFFAEDKLEKMLNNATIEHQILGSDHCPVTLTLKI